MVLLACMILPNYHLFGQNSKVMSYNIRYDNPNDGINKWENRKQEMVEMIRHYQPELLGTQEGLYYQLAFLDSSLTNYIYTGIGREDGNKKGEFCAIFYDTTKFVLLEGSTFWLSENSNTVSVGWDAALERICTYGLFQDIITNKRLWVFNTHFDHIGKKSREWSAQLILQKINRIHRNNDPVILMGDLNCLPDSKPIQLIKTEFSDGAKVSIKPPKGPKGTFNGFNPRHVNNKRIDYIFVKNIHVKSYKHIDSRMSNNNYYSDHLPVLISIITE